MIFNCELKEEAGPVHQLGQFDVIHLIILACIQVRLRISRELRRGAAHLGRKEGLQPWER